MLSQKCQYAVRAIFELAKHDGTSPLKIGDIAEAQAIPPRFLEVILSQLKQAGFVESRRGNEGGYRLRRQPRELTVGEVIRFIEGPLGPVACVTDSSSECCPRKGNCVLTSLWQRAQKAMSDVYDKTTFQDLVNEDAHMRERQAASYVI